MTTPSQNPLPEPFRAAALAILTVSIKAARNQNPTDTPREQLNKGLTTISCTDRHRKVLNNEPFGPDHLDLLAAYTQMILRALIQTIRNEPSAHTRTRLEAKRTELLVLADHLRPDPFLYDPATA